LLKTINANAGDRALKDAVLDKAFERSWIELKEASEEITSEARSGVAAEQVRNDRSLLEEAVAVARTSYNEQSEFQKNVLRSLDRLLILSARPVYLSENPTVLGLAGHSLETSRLVGALAKGSTATPEPSRGILAEMHVDATPSSNPPSQKDKE
jgi:hypothetical protein